MARRIWEDTERNSENRWEVRVLEEAWMAYDGNGLTDVAYPTRLKCYITTTGQDRTGGNSPPYSRISSPLVQLNMPQLGYQ